MQSNHTKDNQFKSTSDKNQKVTFDNDFQKFLKTKKEVLICQIVNSVAELAGMVHTTKQMAMYA